ncbi:MAG: D-tyrosyl-tRNA(Tyr) deacylase [Deltaproteobacteria bacterium]|nr:D-tyrosyl-tRNA(Tyr) deacylase [Deltaproteobacteria bacterium]
MRAVLQRVRSARVSVGNEETGVIGAGLLVLAGAAAGDGNDDVAWVARKILSLRVFADAAGKMNLTVRDVGGSVLLVSQFTLCADLSRGNRPSFGGALDPAGARVLLEALADALKETVPVATGRFGASMLVELANEGPVTLWLDSRAKT